MRRDDLYLAEIVNAVTMMPNDPNPTVSRFPQMKLLVLSDGQPFLFLQESGEPGGEQIAHEIIGILNGQFGAKPLGAIDGFDWVDVDFQIGTQKVTLTSDCWLGLGLIGESSEVESLLIEIAVVLDERSANRMTIETKQRMTGK